MKLKKLLKKVQNDRIEFTDRAIVDGALIIELNDNGVFLEVEKIKNGYAVELSNFGQFDNTNIDSLTFYTKNRTFAHHGSIESVDIIKDYNL